MKKIILIFILVTGLQFTGTSQFEIKTNPLGYLFTYFPVSAEYVINENNGVELLFKSIAAETLYTSFNYKYYLNPKTSGEGFYLGAFLSVGSELGAGGGFHGGYKVLGDKNILFDIGVGAGRTFTGGFTGTGQLSIGYRFKKKGA